MDTTTVSSPVTDDDSLDGIGLDDEIMLDDFDDDDFDDAELEALLERAKPLVDTYTPPKRTPSTEETMPTKAERDELRALLAHSIQSMSPEEFVNDNTVRAVARWHPEELQQFLIPEHFSYAKQADWQAMNGGRMGMHAKAKLALQQATMPEGGNEKPSGNGSIVA
jgi:hypothetical protein